MRAPALILALVSFAADATPQIANAAGLEGTWSGSGIAKPKEGQSERVRCKITYSRESEKVFGVAATCATPSVKFHQTGKVLMVNPNRYVGDFYNPEFDVSGRVRIILRGSSQSISFSGPRGSGSMTLSQR
jgi:hypothetical protein